MNIATELPPSRPGSHVAAFPGTKASWRQWVDALKPRITRCSRGLVVQFTPVAASPQSRDVGYVQLPNTRASLPGNGAPEEAMDGLRELLLSRLSLDPEASDGMTQLLASVVCLLAQSQRQCMLAATRTSKGGLTEWQEERAKAYMCERFGEPVTVDDVARYCGMSAPHFARAFRVSTGVPPYRWLVQQRIDHAKLLLEFTTDALVDISVDCGFAEQSHFTHAFRREVGVAPGLWRRLRQSLAGRVTGLSPVNDTPVLPQRYAEVTGPLLSVAATAG